MNTQLKRFLWKLKIKLTLREQTQLIEQELYISFLNKKKQHPFYTALALANVGEFTKSLDKIKQLDLSNFTHLPPAFRLSLIRRLNLHNTQESLQIAKTLIPDYPDFIQLLNPSSQTPKHYSCPLLQINELLPDNLTQAKTLWKKFFQQQNLNAPHFPFDGNKLNIANLACSFIPLSTSSQKVSIIVSAYNTSKTLSVSLNSLINQSWPNTEIILVDDCSSDNTYSVAKQILSPYPQHKVLKHSINKGSYSARNTAIKASSGDFIMNHDADDWAHPDKIKLQIRAITQQRKKACTSQWFKIDQSTGNLMSPHLYPVIRHCTNSIMFHRDILKNISGYDPVRFAADERFQKQIVKHFGKTSIISLKKTLTIGHHSTNNITSSENTSLQTAQGLRRRVEYRESWAD